MGWTDFTPGPWEVHGYRDFFVVTDARGNEICYIDEIYDYDECEANARLIKATPKLYDALKEAAYEQCHNCPSWDAEKERCGVEDTDCFVREWWKVLDEVEGKETTK